MTRHRTHWLAAAITALAMMMLVAPSARAVQPSFLHVEGRLVGESVQVRLALFDKHSRPIAGQVVTVSGPHAQAPARTGGDGWAEATLPLGGQARSRQVEISVHFAGNQRFATSSASTSVGSTQGLAPQQTQSADPTAATNPLESQSPSPDDPASSKRTTMLTAKPSTTTAFPGDAIEVTGQLVGKDGTPIQGAMIGTDVGGVAAKGMDLTDAQGTFETRASIPVSEGPGPITVKVSFRGSAKLEPAETSFELEVKPMPSPSESAETPSLDPSQTDTSVPSQEPETGGLETDAPTQPASSQPASGSTASDTLLLVGGVGALVLLSTLVVGLVVGQRGRRIRNQTLSDEPDDLIEEPIRVAAPEDLPVNEDHSGQIYQNLDETQVMSDPWEQNSGWDPPPRRGTHE